MKVTFCTYDGHNCINGINAWLRRLLPSLRDRGIESQVLFITWAKDEDCTTLPVLRQMGFQCHVALLPHYTESHVRWILQTIAADPPDIFVPNYMVPALYAARWIKAAGIPTVGVLHNDDLQYQGIQDQFVFGSSTYKLSAIVPVSQKLEQQVRSGNPQQIQICRIPCGVPFPTQSANPPVDKLKLVYVGRIAEEQKRISEVTQALCRAVREISGVEAVIYGSGPAEAFVEQILRTHGANLPIQFAGRIDSEQIQSYLAENHVLVLLSDYEGLPVALMEAMACGLVPICSYMESGIPELVTHEETGLLVHNRSDEFISAVLCLRENIALWKSLSKKARAKIETQYTHEACVENWEILLRELQAASTPMQVIKIPHRLKLPAKNLNLLTLDPREPPAHTKLIMKLKILTNQTKQKLFNSA
jgi:colanic acid/amylovoran biosynthesis glycosyltransferase